MSGWEGEPGTLRRMVVVGLAATARIAAIVALAGCAQAQPGLSGDSLGRNPIVLNPMRMIAGEAVAIRGSAEAEPVIALSVIRVSPALPYPPRVEVAPIDSANVGFQLVFPPATPPGSYAVDCNGVNSRGETISATMSVQVDAVTVPKAVAPRVPVILLNGWQAFARIQPAR